ncbi:O-antigen ligase family protein [Rhodophyticola sp. CCM32]|uniref:O-antigen ligase family protein n=1 Tax=Rhodophyticola sp. CCM32 TaxID=2916397 RepID=UPI00107F36C7|nr:O-antigen ligase family protein [Rhodophyticola sp. CCM32]QBY01799.1 O-antigen ligase family protein [Rhodophyticola sp. CCM32]
MTSLSRLVEYGIALFGLFFMSGTLTSFLTPQGSATAPLVQAIGAALGLYSVVALLFTPNSIPRVLGLYWPALLPVLLAVMSLGWTEDTSLTLRRAGSLGLTTAFAFWLVFRFTPIQIFQLVVTMAVSIIAVNFAIIQIQPTRGIHQSYDIINAHHAGSWRGLFGHKNDFGRLTALSTAILVMGFVFGVGGRYLRWGMIPLIGIAIVMITQSSSSQATLLASTVPTSVAALLLMRRISPAGRSIMLVVALPFAIIAALSAQLVFEYVLGLLGRDATLTGRTEIWEGVILSLGGHGVLGGGYGAGWQIVGPRLAGLTGIEVGHAHNGFLDLAVDIGAVGLGLTLVFMLWLGTLAFRSLMQGVEPEISVLALSVILFALIGNVAGSFLLLHNSLYWVLPVVTFAKLRDVPYASYQTGIARDAGETHQADPSAAEPGYP